jgi:hypothetical protein
MPDSRDSRDAPDFLDRLIARHTAPRPAAVRVRPRLPGPFERVEAVRAAAPAPEEDTLPWPATTPPAVPPAQAPYPAAVETRTTHTERERTVVRPARAEQRAVPPTPVVPRPEVPLLRPAAPVTPAPRPVPEAGRRTSGRAQSEPSRTAAPLTVPPGTDAAPGVVPAVLRPSAADTVAAREAVRQAAARRPARAAEQVVQVQIGRLEVTAAPTSGGGGQRTPAKERAGATLSLTEYLTRRN